MDLETRLLIDKIGIGIGFALVLLGLTGEVLGWWNDLGLVLTSTGLFFGLVSLLDANGVRLLSRFEVQERRLTTTQEAMVTNHASIISRQDTMVSNQETMLSNQETMLSNQDRMIELLDRIATTLDERLPGA